MARRERVKKRSLQIVNEHFEHVTNAASATLVDFDQLMQSVTALQVMSRDA